MLVAEPQGIKTKFKRQYLKLLNNFSELSFEDKVRYNFIERPHYAYCIYHAAALAARLNIPKISILEFGVAGGNGLLAIEDIAAQITQSTDIPVEFEIYGFDTGEGMPAPRGPEDLPYWFEANQYRMDQEALKKQLKQSKLVIGNVENTIDSFFEKHNPAPIGVIFIDVDYHSSTQDCFRIFQDDAINKFFLPRIHIYLDDIIGDWIEMYGPHNGMLLSVDEFNKTHQDKKIHMNQNLIPYPHLHYRHQIYYAHLFSHKLYSTYVGGKNQVDMQEELRLGS